MPCVARTTMNPHNTGSDTGIGRNGFETVVIKRYLL